VSNAADPFAIHPFDDPFYDLNLPYEEPVEERYKIKLTIDSFIDWLQEPYEDVFNLTPRRIEELDDRYVTPLQQRHRTDDIDVEFCLRKMRSSIVDNRDESSIRQWQRCCHGIVEYLLRPRLETERDRRMAVTVVYRLSGWVNATSPLHTAFRPAAEDLSEHFWDCKLGPEKTGGPIEIDPQGPDPLSIWRLVTGLNTSGRSDEEKRYVASRFINFLADRNFFDAEVDQADRDWVTKDCPFMFSKFDVGADNVVDIAKRVRISKAAAKQALELGFDEGTTYYPGSAGRQRWFENLRVIYPPLTFDEAFIRLREGDEQAKKSLVEIASRINNVALKNFILNKWEVDHRGFVTSQFVCSLFVFAACKEDVKPWFDAAFHSESHVVSYDVFEKCIGLDLAKELRSASGNIEEKVKAKLPKK